MGGEICSSHWLEMIQMVLDGNLQPGSKRTTDPSPFIRFDVITPGIHFTTDTLRNPQFFTLEKS